jgi:hypothetical protein
VRMSRPSLNFVRGSWCDQAATAQDDRSALLHTAVTSASIKLSQHLQPGADGESGPLWYVLVLNFHDSRDNLVDAARSCQYCVSDVAHGVSG